MPQKQSSTEITQIPDDNEPWQLQQEFLTAQMDRLDNPEYFQHNFSCPDLDAFFATLSTKKEIKKKKNMINIFYERMIHSVKPTKVTLYVRLKWIVYHHEVISKMNNGSPFFPYVLKALQFYTDSFEDFSQKYGPYEKYLMKILVKPYIQHLSKLCLLSLPQEKDQGHSKQFQKSFQNEQNLRKSVGEVLQNINSSSASQSSNQNRNKENFLLKVQPVRTQKHKTCQNSPSSTPTQTSTIETKDKKEVKFASKLEEDGKNSDEELSISVQVGRWYRIFNFIMSALQIFDKSLKEVESFFSSQLPYLMKISELIINDLNIWILKLKYGYRSLKKLDITLIEIDQLESKLKSFKRSHEVSVLENIDIDYSEDEIKDFMCSPLKKFCELSPIKRKKSYTKKDSEKEGATQ